MENRGMENKRDQKAFFDPAFVILVILLCIMGSIIGMQLITTLGISANTSIIGALFAMILGRIPFAFFYRFKSIHRQNLIQTSISAATFGAANSLFIPLGVPYVMGRPDLVIPMLIGAAIALVIDGLILYKVFGSKVFPESGAWPPGIAAAESIKAGDEGGAKAKYLGLGILGGIGGAWLGIPMSAFGVAFIGNIVALTMFGIGLLLRGYAEPLFGLDLDALYVPHGVMIGAGIIALGQFMLILIKERRQNKKPATDTYKVEPSQDEEIYTRSEQEVTRAFSLGYVAYVATALLLAVISGIATDMSIGMLIIFVLFAGFAALATEVIVGVAAMYSGWFPAFAVSLITLIIGLLIGFPPVSLAILVGFTAATGPAFADFGYDLKAGHILRKGRDLAFELEGRKLQLQASMIGFVVAIIMVAIFYESYFEQGLIPPVDFVYATTIEAGVTTSIAWSLAIWAVPGALLQLIGGPTRQMGILFATGLLIFFPAAGWTVLAGLAIRITILKIRGPEAENTMYTTAAGFIAGDALYSFFTSVFRAR